MKLEVTLNEQDPPEGIHAAVKLLKNPNITVKLGKVTKVVSDEGSVATTLSPTIMRILGGMSKSLYHGTPTTKSEIDHWLTFAEKKLKPVTPEALDNLEQSLKHKSYLVGEQLSVADLAVYEKFKSRKVDQVSLLQDKVNIQRWFAFIEANIENYADFEDLKVRRVKVKDPLAAGDGRHVGKQATKGKGGEKEGKKVEKDKSQSGQKGDGNGNAGRNEQSKSNKDSNSNKKSDEGGKEKKKDEGKFVELPGAEMGKVVVRFPPEASGFLHIGHAKAALLNQYYQQMFQGKLIMRFDDTNPAKENVEFEEAILEDLAMLQIKPDQYTYTSNYFDLMLGLCEDLIKSGHAYADDTDAETMKIEREKRQPSKNYNNSVEKNLELWSEMKKGSLVGQGCCIRAKIDMNSNNGCLRDPTIYRCKNEVHPRTGDKFKVYPTYDFACPIVDSLEGVTHALRTTEYHDRDEQFYWFIDVLKLRRPFIYSYSRLNLTNTVLSKRRLTWFVDQKLVDGWDDPRFPTVRGVLRRGMTVEGLKQFIVAQGSSRSVVMMEWDKIWAFNRKVIDPVAPRHTGLTTADRILVSVQGVEEASQDVAAHPKNPEVGTRKVWTSSKIWVEKSDAVLFKEGENVTFINWGNIKIVKIAKDSKGEVTSVEAVPNLGDKDYKNTMKITWLADTSKSALTPIITYYFDHIISKAVLGKDEDFKQYIGQNTRVKVDMVGDEDLRKVKKGDIIQLQRKGFFICDQPFVSRSSHSFVEQPIILNAIPDGHTKEMPTAKVPNKKDQTVSSTAATAKSNPAKAAAANSGTPEAEIRAQVDEQGVKVRKLKEAKAAKGEVDIAVKALLELKARYKEVTGQDYTATPSAAPAKVGTLETEIRAQVDQQGAKVRQLKEAKAAKGEIDVAVKGLLALKAKYKDVTGQDYVATPAAGGGGGAAKPQPVKANQEKKPAVADPNPNRAQVAPVTAGVGTLETEIRAQVDEQGAKVRQLKGAKAGKGEIDAAVKSLLELKAKYKEVTGQDYVATPSAGGGGGAAKPQPSKTNEEKKPAVAVPNQAPAMETEIRAQVDEQGAKVRQLKEAKAAKGDIDVAVKGLLELKAKYKEVTGQDYVATPSAGGGGGARKPQPSKTKEEKKPAASPAQPANPNLKKQTRLGLEAKKSENLPDWFSQVITKGEMIEYYDVSGCYILRPWSYSIWEAIQAWFDKEIKKLGVENAYFPMFVSHAALEKEKNHIADFAPEVAWVTKSGDTDLAEPVAIRPTSETVMYPSYAKWVQSYRDLPIKLNQWNNVVRWEFKHPQPFLRTREFLWQEGHTAFATFEEAKEEVLHILGLYEKVYTDLLAIPVIPGKKTEKEKFPGGDYTTTVEAFVSASGRGLQGATSHHLGQNFSKMFEIVFEDPETKQKQFAYQNSWGLSTRTIGAMIMVHSDDNGLVLPPRVARYQVVIIPCGLTVNTTDAERNELLDKCKEFEKGLLDADIRAKADYRDNYSPGWKFNHWELKGVPVRVEIGPRDLKEGNYVAVSRHNGVKTTLSFKSFAADTAKLLIDIHDAMFQKAKAELDSHITVTEDWNTFCGDLDKKNIIMAPFCGAVECEEHIKKDSSKDEPSDSGAPAMGAKSLCIPFKQPKELQATTKCVHPKCTAKPQFYTLFGRSY